APPPSRVRAVLYARVSSKEQEKEGFSIPAQRKLLHDYAVQNDLLVDREFVDVETAKQSGRKAFSELIGFLKTAPDCQAILVEKVDRVTRNLKDAVLLDELIQRGVQLHFVKENTVISRESRSSDKFMFGIRVLVAKNYVDNLGEES